MTLAHVSDAEIHHLAQNALCDYRVVDCRYVELGEPKEVPIERPVVSADFNLMCLVRICRKVRQEAVPVSLPFQERTLAVFSDTGRDYVDCPNTAELFLGYIAASKQCRA